MRVREDGRIHVDEVIALADGGLFLSISAGFGHGWGKYMSGYGPIFVLDWFVGHAWEPSGDPMHHTEAFVNDGRLCCC